ERWVAYLHEKRDKIVLINCCQPPQTIIHQLPRPLGIVPLFTLLRNGKGFLYWHDNKFYLHDLLTGMQLSVLSQSDSCVKPDSIRSDANGNIVAASMTRNRISKACFVYSMTESRLLYLIELGEEVATCSLSTDGSSMALRRRKTLDFYGSCGVSHR